MKELADGRLLYGLRHRWRFRLQKINDGNGVGFTWTDVLGATEYNLYGDVEPDGAFDHQLGSSTTGETGIDLPDVQAAAFFLLTPGSACGGGG